MPAFSWLVRPLEEPYREKLDAVAARHGFPTSRQPVPLGEAVRKLSDVYNRRATGKDALPSHDARAHLGARLGFSFPRDVPKGAAAVRELVGTGLVALSEEKALRVLDFGAGLGAMSHGLARALEAHGQQGEMDLLCTDADSSALALAREIGAPATGGPVQVRLRTEMVRVGDRIPRGPFDVILLGQVLSELDESADETTRITAHLDLVDALFRELGPAGSLVIVEPALRDRSRHLHALRDAFVVRGGAPFAPCLHAGPCPALLRDEDWCHEDLSVDLPPWLVPVAKSAGLRYQGLSFSYLVLRKDGQSLNTVLPHARLRSVSELLRSKGKTEAFLCGVFPGGSKKERMRRLDRHASEANAPWERIGRGSLLELDLPEAGVRIAEDARVALVAEKR